MTTALYDSMRSDGDLAAVLSERITEYLHQGDISRYPQAAQFRGQLLAAAGFDPRVATEYQAASARVVTPRIASGINGGLIR